MRFASPPRRSPPESVVPMINVVFLLLIFFVVTASFQLQKAIAAPSTKTDQPSRVAKQDFPQTQQIELQIDAFGGFLVLASDWQTEVVGKQNLISVLKRAAPGTDAIVLIKAHADGSLQKLVDAMDAATEAKYSMIEVMQVDHID